MKISRILFVLLPLLSVAVISCNASDGENEAAHQYPMISKSELHATATATFAGGCFWCIEAQFEKVPGVAEVVSGYTGGTEVNPTYHEVGSGKTGHAESVQVHYDPSVVTYEQLVDYFWRQFDPTDAGGSFYDRGSQYRPGIFYNSDEQKQIAEASLEKLKKSGRFDKPIVTPIEPLGVFYPAEEYHQDYYKKDPDDYYSYRRGSGRDRFIDRIWGEDRDPQWLKDIRDSLMMVDSTGVGTPE